MKLVEKLEQARGPFYTFEFFPPRTEQVSPDIVHRTPVGPNRILGIQQSALANLSSG